MPIKLPQFLADPEDVDVVSREKVERTAIFPEEEDFDYRTPFQFDFGKFFFDILDVGAKNISRPLTSLALEQRLKEDIEPKKRVGYPPDVKNSQQEDDEEKARLQQILQTLPEKPEERFEVLRQQYPFQALVGELALDPTNLIGMGVYSKLARGAAMATRHVPVVGGALRATEKVVTTAEEGLNWLVKQPVRPIGAVAGKVSEGILRAASVSPRMQEAFFGTRLRMKAATSTLLAVRQSLGHLAQDGTVDDTQAFLQSMRDVDSLSEPMVTLRQQITEMYDAAATRRGVKDTAESAEKRFNNLLDSYADVPASELGHKMAQDYAALTKKDSLENLAQRRKEWSGVQRALGGAAEVALWTPLVMANELNRFLTGAMLYMTQIGPFNVLESGVRAAIDGHLPNTISWQDFNKLFVEAPSYLMSSERAHTTPLGIKTLFEESARPSTLIGRLQSSHDALRNWFIEMPGKVELAIRRGYFYSDYSDLAKTAVRDRKFNDNVQSVLNLVDTTPDAIRRQIMAAALQTTLRQSADTLTTNNISLKDWRQFISAQMPDMPAEAQELVYNWRRQGAVPDRFPMERVLTLMGRQEASIPETTVQYLETIGAYVKTTPAEQLPELMDIQSMLLRQFLYTPSQIRRNAAREVAAAQRVGQKHNPETIWRHADGRLDAYLTTVRASLDKTMEAIRIRGNELTGRTGRGTGLVKRAIAAHGELSDLIHEVWRKDQEFRVDFVGHKGSQAWTQGRDVIWREYEDKFEAALANVQSTWRRGSGRMARGSTTPDHVKNGGALPGLTWSAYNHQVAEDKWINILEGVKTAGIQTHLAKAGARPEEIDQYQRLARQLGDAIEKDEDAKIWFSKKGKEILKTAEENLDHTFTSYDKANALDDVMRVIFPFWLYETRSLQWLMEKSISRPIVENLLSPLGNALGNPHGLYWKYTDERGYLPVTDDDQYRPISGTIFGRLDPQGPWEPRRYQAQSDLQAVKTYNELYQKLAAFGIYPGVLWNATIKYTYPILKGEGKKDPMLYASAIQDTLPPPITTALDIIGTIDGSNGFLSRFGEEELTKALLANGENPANIRANKDTDPEAAAAFKKAARVANFKQIIQDQLGMFRYRPKVIQEIEKKQKAWVKQNFDPTKQQLKDMETGKVTLRELFTLTPDQAREYGEIFKSVPGYEQRGRYLSSPKIQETRNQTDTYFDTFTKLRSESDERQADRDNQLINGKLTTDEWKDLRNQDQSNLSFALDELKRKNPLALIDNSTRSAYNLATGRGVPQVHPISAALDIYYAEQPNKIVEDGVETSRLDYDEFRSRRQSIIDSFSPETREGLLKEIGRNDSPVEKLYKSDQEFLRIVYDARTSLQERYDVKDLLRQRKINPSFGAVPESMVESRYPNLAIYDAHWAALRETLVRTNSKILSAALRWDTDLVPGTALRQLASGKTAIINALLQK
mgnify:FL=1